MVWHSELSSKIDEFHAPFGQICRPWQNCLLLMLLMQKLVIFNCRKHFAHERWKPQNKAHLLLRRQLCRHSPRLRYKWHYLFRKFLLLFRKFLLWFLCVGQYFHVVGSNQGMWFKQWKQQAYWNGAFFAQQFGSTFNFIVTSSLLYSLGNQAPASLITWSNWSGYWCRHFGLWLLLLLWIIIIIDMN